MKTILLSVLFVVLSGCATFEVEAPISNRFTETIKPIDKLEFSTDDILPIPKSPELTEIKFDGKTYAGMNKEGFLTFKSMENALQFNTTVAKTSLNLNYTLMLDRENLILLGTYEEQRANYYAEKWATNEEELLRNEAYHRVEAASYQVLLGLALLAMIL